MAKSKVSQLVEDEDFEAVERLRGMYGPGFTLRISRTELGRRDFAFLDDWAGTEFPSEVLLRDTYGGGRYQLEVRDADHQYVKGGRAYITIAGPAKTSAVAPQQGGTVDATVRFALETMQKVVTDQREGKPAKAQDLPALITAVSGAVVALATLLQRPDSGNKLRELKELLELVKELTPERGGGSGEGGEGIAGAIVEGVHTLAGLVRRQEQLAPGAPPAAPGAGGEPAPDAAGGGKPGAGAAAPAAVGEEWLAALQPYIPDLLELAADDADPALYADLYVDQLERKQPLVLEFLDAKLAGDSGGAALFEQQFMRGVPDAGQYPDWFSELFKELRRALLERRKDLEEAERERRAAEPTTHAGPETKPPE